MRVSPMPCTAHLQIQNRYLQETVCRLEMQLQSTHTACELKDQRIKQLKHTNKKLHKQIEYFSNIIKRLPVLPLACLYSNTCDRTEDIEIPCAKIVTELTNKTTNKTTNKAADQIPEKKRVETEDEWISI